MKRSHLQVRQFGIAVLLAVFVVSSTACQFSLIQLPPWLSGQGSTATPEIPGGPTPTPMPMAQVTFIAVLPEPLAEGETLTIAILDEITGLALNGSFYPMQPRDPQTYAVSLAFPLNSTVKYRYVRKMNSLVTEFNLMRNTSVSLEKKQYYFDKLSDRFNKS